jgi:SAM-dependent methyltransferase
MGDDYQSIFSDRASRHQRSAVAMLAAYEALSRVLGRRHVRNLRYEQDESDERRCVPHACRGTASLLRPVWQASRMTMRQGWESEAENWLQFTRPGVDRSHENINLPVLLELLPSPGARTLDLACGEGRLSRLLKSRQHRVVGIDAAPTMVQFAADDPDAAPVLRADATELPFADHAFDLVVAYMCLHDIDDMPQAVRELARVLAPEGRACVAIQHPIITAGSFENRDAQSPFVIHGSYLDPAPLRMVADRDGVSLTFHGEHRPLEAYFHAMADAGLLTETIREVSPPDQVVLEHPSDGRWRRIPLFLHLRALKPR